MRRMSRAAHTAVAAVFEPKDLVDFTLAFTAMEYFNRLYAPFRLPVQAALLSSS